MPSSFIARIEGIKANGKQAVTWGGRWTSPSRPDAMHFQINVAPADCKNVTWDDGGDFVPEGGGENVAYDHVGDNIATITDADTAWKWQGSIAPGTKQASYNPSNDAEANDRVWMVLGRIADLLMQFDQRMKKGGM